VELSQEESETKLLSCEKCREKNKKNHQKWKRKKK